MSNVWRRRHAEYGRFIERVFSDEGVLKYLRSKVLEEVYRRLTVSERPWSLPFLISEASVGRSRVSGLVRPHRN